MVYNRHICVSESWHISLSCTDGLGLLTVFQDFHIYVHEHTGDCCPQQESWSKLPSLLLLKLNMPRLQSFHKILSQTIYIQVIHADQTVHGRSRREEWLRLLKYTLPREKPHLQSSLAVPWQTVLKTSKSQFNHVSLGLTINRWLYVPFVELLWGPNEIGRWWSKHSAGHVNI